MAYPVGEEQNLFWIKMTKMSSIKMKHLWLNGRSRLLAEEGTGGASQAPYQTSRLFAIPNIVFVKTGLQMLST